MDEARAALLYREADAGRWSLPPAAFAEALARSAAKAFGARTPASGDLERYLATLHLTDLALATACALGHDEAWDHFVSEFRPALYRAADAVAPGGGAREVADALYADLYGLKERDGERRSLFRYFHGRSSLSTWLRSLVAQRYVDRIRETRRLDPLPGDSSPTALPSRPAPLDPDRRRFATAMRGTLGLAIAALAPRDRLLLGCYYAQEMTLAQIGRLTGEHEATVSRHLARMRRALRVAVEQGLRAAHGFGEAEITECFASLSADAGPLDLHEWLDPEAARKKPGAVRSSQEDPS
ncbi:MAG: sigma-70 family RNA polymerase sigma factor [Acidobacteriota bacterium]|nr:sigma-70 family RNA polymerase sigma factor [Acidobacteriota bacterium]